MKFAIRGPWSSPPEKFKDVEFLRSWLEFDSESEGSDRSSRLNWNALMGLGLMIGISASFWTGVGFMAAHFLK